MRFLPRLRRSGRDHKLSSSPGKENRKQEIEDRQTIVLRTLSKSDRIIEIGPSYSPLVAKRDGWNTFIIDHASREDLVAKYRDNPVLDVSKIEEVDFTWTSGSIADAVPAGQHGTFDAFVASHVIEHTTDLVAFLKAAEMLLREGGQVLLVVPDKRKCFDLFRPLSSTGQAIEAYTDKRSRHTMTTFLNHWLNVAVKPDGGGCFPLSDNRPMQFAHPPLGLEDWMGFSNADHYIDAHAWSWTPSSFELMILELGQLGFINLRTEVVTEAENLEFYVRLRKGFRELPTNVFQEQRMNLNYAVLLELAKQAQQVPQQLA